MARPAAPAAVPAPKAAPRRARKRAVDKVRDTVVGAIAIACVCAVLAPLFPYVQLGAYELTHPITPIPETAFAEAAAPKKQSDSTAKPTAAPGATLASVPAASEPNRLTIPKIGVDADILEGADESTLDKGIWRRPNTSTPERGGNTVVVAHRFKYLSGGNTFFHLDKVAAGDEIDVRWDGKEYRYQVTGTEVVSIHQVSIENPTDTPQLTLYTCTPLWTSKQRLVVHASLQETS